ncbi:hypothetical protein E4U21_000920 [Claviceps maximensis]|nr:hypothetical protein E4U21_000920 [Claviceps maximensis]
MSGTQTINDKGDRAIQFPSNHWESGYTSSTDNDAIMQRSYAIQRFSNHSDDPYVASGIIPTPRLLGNDQAPCIMNRYSLQQIGFHQNVVRQLSERTASFVDSGYEGSHMSRSASSPSTRTGKAGEAHNLKYHRNKSNTRKKTEWPRKDNFLAHLDRIHHIRYRPTDNLDQYVIRVQHNPQDLTENVASISDQAQHLALQGIGTGVDADLNATHLGTDLANELAPADQANDVYQEQRLSMFMYRNSRVLANASLLGPSAQGEFVSQGMLNSQEYNLDSMGINLPIAYDDGYLQQPLAQSFVQSAHHIKSDASNLSNPWCGTNQSDGDVSECDENEEYGCNSSQDSSSNGNVSAMASQSRQELTTTSLHITSNVAHTSGLSGMVELSSQLTESEDIMRLLRKIPRETLQAALDSRGPESDEGHVAGISGATRLQQHLCPTCQKAFKRQSQLNEEGCELECNRRETFKMHLKNDHCLSIERVDHIIDQCRQGRHWNTEFWCGFCVKHIEAGRSNSIENAWIQRVDHIDAHFCGKGTLVKRGIEEWTYEQQRVADSQGFLNETRCSTSVEMSPAASIISASQKRLASQMESESPDRKRTRSKWIEMWQCCGCNMFMTGRTSSTCEPSTQDNDADADDNDVHDLYTNDKHGVRANDDCWLDNRHDGINLKFTEGSGGENRVRILFAQFSKSQFT